MRSRSCFLKNSSTLSAPKITEQPRIRHVHGPLEGSYLVQALHLRRQAAVHAKYLIIDDGGHRETVKTLGERLPEANAVAALALVVETVDPIDRSAFVVSSEDEEVIGKFDFVAEEKADCLHALLPSVDVVAEEEGSFSPQTLIGASSSKRTETCPSCQSRDDQEQLLLISYQLDHISAYSVLTAHLHTPKDFNLRKITPKSYRKQKLPLEGPHHLDPELGQHEPNSEAPIVDTHANLAENSLQATAAQLVFLATFMGTPQKEKSFYNTQVEQTI
nr:ABC1 family protein, putative [Ipomoea batatas]